MSLVTGTVECLSISSGSGLFSIRTGPSTLEPFILWFGNVRADGPISIWVPELSLALSKGLTVTVSSGASSAYVDSVRINAP